MEDAILQEENARLRQEVEFLKGQVDLACRIRDNFQKALGSATNTIESLYADAGPLMDPSQAARWASQLGMVNDAHATLGVCSFGDALNLLNAGEKVARSGWNGSGMWIAKQSPDEGSKMTAPYLYIEYPEGHTAYPNGMRAPWVPSQTDLFAIDWVVFGE